MRKSKIKQISLAVCLALMPFSSFAAGLGKLNVSSGLGEPLKAEVELLSVTPDELSTLVAAIASEEAYAAQGIVRLGIHNAIKVDLSKNADGTPVLKLHSNQPVSDPYLDMLIQVDWASGRLQREYTVLLDPPEYKQVADVAVPAAITSPSLSASSEGAQQSDDSFVAKAQKSKKYSNKLPAPQAENSDFNEDKKLTTKRGDTLNSIAKQMQIEGVSLDQMLVGLYGNNKEAFSSGNMNRLKVGKIIKAPTKESLIAIGALQAKESVKVHSTNWNAYRNSLAGIVGAAPVLAESEHKQTVSGKIATAEDKAALVKAGPQDVVKLSAGDKDLGNANKNAAKAADAKVVALQEEATAREKTLKEAQERAAALEKQIQDMQKLLALKSQTMLNLQKNAEMTAKEAAKKHDEKAEAVLDKAPEIAKVEIPQSIESKPIEKIAAKPVPEVKKQANIPQVKLQPQVPQAEVSLLDSLMSAVDLTILGGASGIALLGAGWMYLRNKRRKDLDSFERGILTSGGLRANTVFGNTTGNASTSDTSFLTDFAQSANGSMIDANDVDPIAEAEVYMAYGRDAQAEEILKDAISKEPKRYELHLKLFEMYAGQRDTSAFEAVAGELYTTLGADDPTWAKIAEMGATIEPENPLYEVGKSAGSKPEKAEKLDASDFSDVEVSMDGLDFSLGDEVLSSDEQKAEGSSLSSNVMDLQTFSVASSAEQDDSLEFDSKDKLSLNIDSSAESLSFESMKGSVEYSTGNEVIDFDIDIDVESIKAPSLEVVAEVPAIETFAEAAVIEDKMSIETTVDSVMDFDLGDFNLSDESPVEVVQEKIDEDLPPFDFTSAADDIGPPMVDLPSTVDAEATNVVATDTTTIEKSESDTNESSVSDFNIEFDLPMEVQDEVSERTAQTVASAISDISFDLDATADELVEDGLSLDLDSSNSVVSQELSNISLPVDDVPATKSSSKKRSAKDLKSIDLADSALMVSDTPADEPESVAKVDAEEPSTVSALEANEFDLSTISLDLDDALSEAGLEEISFDSPVTGDVSLESQDVEIKLDLVAAYIDMDDMEGARELLEEVLNEGGPQQQARAQELLDSLA